MKKVISLILALAALAAVSAGTAQAQPGAMTVTNYVTVIVTNYVTITNVVPPAPAHVATAALTAGTPAAPKMETKYPWQSSISAGMTLARGNSDTFLATADFTTQKKTPFNEYKIDLSTAYGDQNAKATVNNYKESGQWNHLFTPRFFSYVRTDGLRDIISEVDYRLTIGPGVGYYLVKSTNTTLALEGGTAFEAQKLDGKADQTFDTLRAAERFEHKVNDHVRLWQNVEILPQVDEFDNYTVNFEIGLETTLSKSFTLKTYLDDSYNHRPAPGKLRNDAKLVTALGFKF